MKLWLRLYRLIFSRLSCLVMQKKFNDCYSAVTQHSQNPDIEEVLDAAGEVSSCIQLVDENNPNLKTINLSISSTKLQLKRKAMDEARAEYLRDRTDENLNKAIQATGDAIAQGGEFIQDLSGFVDYPKINGMGLEDIGMVIEGYGKAITVGNKYLGPWLGENLPLIDEIKLPDDASQSEGDRERARQMYDRWNDAKRTSSPLVFDLNGDGVVETLSRDKHNIYFDHAGDGFAERTGWAQNASSQTAGQSAPARAGHAPKRRSCHGGSCARPRAIGGIGRQRQLQKKAWRQLLHHRRQPHPTSLVLTSIQAMLPQRSGGDIKAHPYTSALQPCATMYTKFCEPIDY